MVRKLHRFDVVSCDLSPLSLVLLEVACDFDFGCTNFLQELHNFLGVVIGKGLVVCRKVLTDRGDTLLL